MTGYSILDLILKATIGFAASWLAYQQHKLGKSKLRFELYDKRYALFLTLRLFVSDLAIGDANEPLESLGNAGTFKRDTIESRFLFDDRVVRYFDEVYKKATKLANIRVALERPNLTEAQIEEMKEEENVLRTWFFDQSDAMFTLFRKDLAVKTLE
ncbi:MAG: hypothetical protein ABR555_07455 [Pyrinomonadaceae bacterium]